MPNHRPVASVCHPSCLVVTFEIVNRLQPNVRSAIFDSFPAPRILCFIGGIFRRVPSECMAKALRWMSSPPRASYDSLQARLAMPIDTIFQNSFWRLDEGCSSGGRAGFAPAAAYEDHQ